MTPLILLIVLALLSTHPAAQADIIRDLEYAKVGSTALKLDLHLPQETKSDLLIVWVHGGAWRSGSKDIMKLGKLVEEGTPVASVDYRLSPVAQFPAQVHDIKAAIRFLRATGANWNLPTATIVIAGESAGGHLAALVGVSNGHPDLEGSAGDHLGASSDVQGIVSFFGASNLTTILSQSTPHGLSVRVPALELLLGDLPQKATRLARLASPVFHVDADDPPLLLLHGDQDPQMPINQAHELDGAYQQMNRPVTFATVHGAAHGGDRFYDDKRFAIVRGFLQQLGPADGEFPRFTAHTIDHWGNKLGQTALVDVDRDGDLDWIAGNASHAGDIASQLSWWEYQAANRWVRHDLGRGNTDVGGAASDVDGDGWIDVVAGSTLLLNAATPRGRTFIEFDIGAIHSHDTEFADVNGDGRMDLIANSDKTGLFWYEIPEDPRQKWPQHEIASSEEHKVHGGVSPQAVGDIDGDGDPDVVTARIWYENLGGGVDWKPHANIEFGEDHIYGIAVRTWVGDLDRDGDNDLVQAENDNPDSRIAWFANDGRGNWTRHMIRDAGQGQDWHSLAVADFDSDGDLDVYAGAGPLSASKKFACYIWENSGGGRSWTEHEILKGKQCHEAEAADVDGDGDIDICTKPWSGTNEHVFLENRFKNP